MSHPLKADFMRLKRLYTTGAISAAEYLAYERALAEQFVLSLEGKEYLGLEELLYEHLH